MGVTGGKETQIFNNLMGEVTPELIDLMKPFVLQEIIKSLQEIATEYLDSAKIPYSDILACLTGNPNCPI
jgi:hypothetical protein